MATILIVEHSGSYGDSFVPALESKGFEVHKVSTGKMALKYARQNKPDLLILDAASMGTSGNRICAVLSESLNGLPLVHIRPQTHAVDNEKAGPADVSLDMPFTARKLINRIKGLIADDHNEVLVQGPIKLNIVQRTVRSYGKEKHLTPKCASLLEIFMRNPNETMSRKALIKKVWKTDYVGDTRTLDVHVRWLRQAVERRSTRPRHLVTVRGIGYRFEPEPGAAGPSAIGKSGRRRSSGSAKSGSKS